MARSSKECVAGKRCGEEGHRVWLAHLLEPAEGMDRRRVFSAVFRLREGEGLKGRGATSGCGAGPSKRKSRIDDSL